MPAHLLTSNDKMLTEHLRFSPDLGHIVLFDQRMLLMHAHSFALLRRELIDQLGLAKAREMLTRMGYQQGFDDGQHARTLGPEDRDEVLSFGPRLREIEGFVRNLPIRPMHYDPAQREFWGDYHWTASWEAEAHLQHHGVCGEPTCWLMVGYASGYCTAVLGEPILWRETECLAMGHDRCRVVGKPLAHWEQLAPEETQFLAVQDFVRSPGQARRGGGASATPVFDGFIGSSAGFNAVANLVQRVAGTDTTVLFRGESGVGKERFARTLHSISKRQAGPWVAVNCAAIPPELVEAELFGVERGAFTGADRSRPGRFERAHGGTLFLDEIGSLPLPAQGKLLRVLQEREIERVGDTQVRPVDVRVVAACNRDLRDEVAQGRFREDLFYRLNVFPILIPPLRERREDIPLLVASFLERANRRCGRQVRGLSRRAFNALWDYGWPGNVRELENMIERAVILADDGGHIDVQHLFSGGERPDSHSLALGRQGKLVAQADAAAAEEARAHHLADELLAELGSFEQIESLLFERAMARTEGNLSAAARLLGMRRGQVEYRLKKRAGDEDAA